MNFLLKIGYFHFWFLYKIDLRISCYRKTQGKFIHQYWQDKGLKCLVENRALPPLHGGSFEGTSTVPLKVIFFIFYFYF